MLTSIKSLVAVANAFTAETLKVVSKATIFDSCTKSDLLHFAILAEVQKAINNELSSVVSSADYISEKNADRDSRSMLFYLVSHDTSNNLSKYLCKVYLKKDLHASILINASLKKQALENEILQSHFDKLHEKKYTAFDTESIQELVKLLKLIISLNK